MCPVDQSITYIGKTNRHLITRIVEHSNIKHSSSIVNHFSNCSCKSNIFDNFSILNNCNNVFDLKIRESLHILKAKPSLNIQINQGMEFTVKFLINIMFI